MDMGTERNSQLEEKWFKYRNIIKQDIKPISKETASKVKYCIEFAEFIKVVIFEMLYTTITVNITYAINDIQNIDPFLFIFVFSGFNKILI